MIWVHGAADAPEQDLPALRVRVLLLSRNMAERKISMERTKDDVLGQGNRDSRWAYIFSDRITAAAAKHARECAGVFGPVIDHEVGHLMLPVDSHSDTGHERERRCWVKQLAVLHD